jgi:hypothetical protein
MIEVVTDNIVLQGFRKYFIYLRFSVGEIVLRVMFLIISFDPSDVFSGFQNYFCFGL